ncbi:hypothetical protein FA15DRAFT_599279 [Coprinopsis marcescibilis]|uniref:Uncharacterized protein n=1 Tax=Coprinopsis marcescibilis TaxID=230819 RepID=A0A5C3KKB6_COPMA|nr:hypothetical protein FA15DRAFT_599279 [Coprinopsis marcescibilis]
MREYLSNKFPDPIHHPLEAPRGAAPGSSADRDKILAEYKGAIYGRQCLTSQQVILEFLLGKCLEQCRICLDELRKTQSASRLAEDSTSYIVRHGQSRGVNFDVDGVNAESSRLFRRVREDLYELAEELRDLDGSRQLALQFLRSPGTVLPLS